MSTRNFNGFFDELNEMADMSKWGQHKMTDEEYNISIVKDVIEWADGISGQWDGDEPGSDEDRANQANDIMQKANELIELIEGMENL